MDRNSSLLIIMVAFVISFWMFSFIDNFGEDGRILPRCGKATTITSEEAASLDSSYSVDLSQELASDPEAPIWKQVLKMVIRP